MRVKNVFVDGELFSTCLKSQLDDAYDCAMRHADDDESRISVFDDEIGINEWRAMHDIYAD